MAADKLSAQEFERVLAAQAVAEESSPEVSPPRVLRLLTSVDRQLLSQITVEERYEPGEIVFREGEDGESVYLIWSGQVAAVKGGFAAPVVLGYRGPGEMVGEMALLEHRPRMASIVVLEPARLLKISGDGFRRLIGDAPALSIGIMETLSARLRVASSVRQAKAQTEKLLTSQLTELQQEVRRLVEIQKARQEIGDLIMHDLRSPLNIVYGAVSMLEMLLPEDVLRANRQLLTMASSACGRMQRLVESLLEVSQMESNALPLHRAPTNLQHLIEEAVNREWLALKSGRVTLRMAIPPDLPLLSIDAEQVDRVLANLLENAIQYTPHGGQIVLGAGLQEEHVAVSVTDTGPGVPAEDRERIFDRFARVDQDGRPGTGFGLGLTFCRLAVEAHGGRIWVEPGDGGVGSRFVFTLPLSDGALDASNQS